VRVNRRHDYSLKVCAAFFIDVGMHFW